MSKAKLSLLLAPALALALALTLCFSPAAYAQGAVCAVEGAEYASLGQAFEAVMSGEAHGEIELLADCELDIGSVRAPVTVSGGGYSVAVPKQSGTEGGHLAINSRLCFRDTALSFANPQSWSAVLGPQGELALLEGSDCAFKFCGIYSSPGGTVSLDASSMSLEDMEYTCMMAEAYGELSVKNGSSFTVSRPVGINGLTGFNITVADSDFSVSDCQRQGLVKCSLRLGPGARADISDNGYGYNLYSNNVLTMDSGAELKMEGNGTAAILMQGNSTVSIRSGGSFICRENCGAWTADKSDADYGSKAAIDIGWFNAQYIYTAGVFSVEDGALADISRNYGRALANYGTVYLGSGAVIRDNGALLPGETAAQRRVQQGGGALNAGSLVMAQGAELYNNHASQGGDDIYNLSAAELGLPAVGQGWTLDDTPDTNDCGEPISGWFLDPSEARWNAHDPDKLSLQEQQPGAYTEALPLKAAHGILPAPPTADGSELLLWLTLMAVSAAGLTAIGRRIRRQR